MKTQTHDSTIQPERNINYLWIGPPAQGNLSIVAGHDIAGPIEMAKNLGTQDTSNEDNQSIRFWCLEEYVEFYKEEFQTRGTPSIEVRAVEKLLREEADGPLSQQAKFLQKHVSLLKESENSNNLKDITIDRVAIKDGFSLFLLLSQAGYFFDTNVFPTTNKRVSLPGSDCLQTATNPDGRNDFYIMYSPYREHQKMIEIFNNWSANCTSVGIYRISAFGRNDVMLLGRLERYGHPGFNDPFQLGIGKESYRSYANYTPATSRGLFYWLGKNLKDKLEYGDINQQSTHSDMAFVNKCALIDDFYYTYDVNDSEIFEKLKRLNFPTNEAFAITRADVFYINKSQNLTYKFKSKYYLKSPFSRGGAYKLSSGDRVTATLIQSMEDMQIAPPPYITNIEGATLLHQAIFSDNINDIKLLLDKNADINIKATYLIQPKNETILVTPLELAEFLNNEPILELFKQLEKPIKTKLK